MGFRAVFHRGLDGATLMKMLVQDTYSEMQKEKLMQGLKAEVVLFMEEVSKLL